MRIDPFTILAGRATVAALLLAAIAGCGGGGGFVELFVKEITAEFHPATVTLSPGASTSVELEVNCYAGVGSYYLGAVGSLPAGISVTVPPAPSPGVGTPGFLCNIEAPDPDHSIGRTPIVVSVAAGTPPLSTSLRLLVNGGGDDTFADLTIRVSATTTPG